MGCSQAVRHRVLIPAFPGSNPGTPATFLMNHFFRHSCVIPAPQSRHSRATVASFPCHSRVIPAPQSRHSRATVASFPCHSRVIPAPQSCHSRATVASFPRHSRVIPVPQSCHSRATVVSFPRRRESIYNRRCVNTAALLFFRQHRIMSPSLDYWSINSIIARSLLNQ